MDVNQAEDQAKKCLKLLHQVLEEWRRHFLWTKERRRGNETLPSTIPKNVFDNVLREIFELENPTLESVNAPSGDNDASFLLHHILLPLLHSLRSAYFVLDRIPQQQSTEKRNKPAPPVGMLSLQQYTDVACVVEWVVSAGLLVYGDKNRPLPKSLAGRLPVATVAWAQGAPVAYGASLAALVPLLLLDRFRPMLLPRHLTDLMSGIFMLQGDTNSMKEDKGQASHWLEWLQKAVDDTSLARAYQSLLMRGEQTPVAIKHGASKGLQSLCSSNLLAVQRAFCPLGDRSAPRRLARVLPAAEAVYRQVWILWDSVALPMGIKDRQAKGLTEEEASRVELVWAVLEEAASTSTLERLLTSSYQTSTESSTFIPHIRVRRLAVLALAVPTTVREDLWRTLIFSHWRELVQLATLQSPLQSILRNDVIWTLRLWVAVISEADLPWLRVGGTNAAVMALASGLFIASNEASYTLKGSSKNGLEEVETLSVAVESLEQACEILKRRAEFLVNELVVPITVKVNSDTSAIEGSCTLPSQFFRLLLGMYSSLNGPAASGVHGLIAMVCLPVLCESCSVESLMLSEEDAVGIFETILVVLRGLVGAGAESRGANGLKSAGCTSFAQSLTEPDRFALEVTGVSFDLELDGLTDSLAENLSDPISALLLNILIGVLELGSPQRSAHEEELLRRMMDPLEQLSVTDVDQLDRTVSPGLKELASHALALIASRAAVPVDGGGPGEERHPRHFDSFESMLKAVEDDLSSTEPPIRARGVVALRHLAFAAADTAQRAASKQPSFILSDKTKRTDPDSLDALKPIIILALSALGDSESYVYLAAVQTLVAIFDLMSTESVTRMISSVILGACESNCDVRVALSLEQRLKFVEAVASYIRRQVAFTESIQSILWLLIYGSDISGRVYLDKGPNMIRMQQETHEFFVAARDDERNADDKKIRMNMGGPLFEEEEGDTLRASKINLLTEIVIMAPQDAMARCSGSLIRCAISTIQLDKTRPVRRAGVLLAREIYASALREQDLVVEALSRGGHEPCTFALSLVGAGEQELMNVLSRCLNEMDSTDLGGENRVVDAATSARAQEALSLRNELETLTLARAALSIREDNKARVVTSMFENNE